MLKKIFSFLVGKKTSPSSTPPKSAHPTTSHSPSTLNKAYFSPGEAPLNAIIHEIKSAKSSLDICVFTISDDRISREIIAAHKRGIKIRLLSDNEKVHDMGSDIEEIAKSGIATRVDDTSAHMHHKFMLIDGRKLLNGSYNWTRSAAMQNQENILVTDDSSVVKAFQKEFEKMWAVMSRL